MRPSTFTIMSLAFLLACGGGDRNNPPASGGAGGESGMASDTGAADTASTGTPAGENEASLSGSMSRLELANSAEIQTSELAAKQAGSPAVKRIAGQLLADHRKNQTELQTLAKQKGVTLVPPSGGSTSRDTAGVLALKSLQGAEFDSAYVAAQLEAHRTNIGAIRNQILPAAQDADVRQFLQKTLAAMEKHQAALQGVQSQLQR